MIPGVASMSLRDQYVINEASAFSGTCKEYGPYSTPSKTTVKLEPVSQDKQVIAA